MSAEDDLKAARRKAAKKESNRRYQASHSQERTARWRAFVQANPERTKKYMHDYWEKSKTRPVPPDALAAAMARYEVNERGCWISAARKDSHGYPILRIVGKRILLHRTALEQKIGRVLEPHEQTRHDCDTPACINPMHLLVGTNADNMADKVARGRQPRGEQSKTAKLTEAAVREIRSSVESPTALAARYGVGYQAIYSVRKRRTWRHI